MLKAGEHAGAYLAVRFNGRLDLFGGAVNMAARVQGLSCGRDVVVTDAVLADIEAEALTSAPQSRVAQSFDAELRGIPTPSASPTRYVAGEWAIGPGASA